ncbi:MAG: SPFH domain-containing protein [bacterium]|nr:MAG: SPFH domain-containing protein [bacterium]
MTEKGNGGQQGPFQDTPVFRRRRPGVPGWFPKLPGIKLPEGGKKPLALAVAVLVLMALVYNFMLVYIAPNEYGIKEVQIGIKRGIRDKVYDTGLHLRIWGMEVMHTFPRDLQSFELSIYPTAITKRFRYEKAAHIQTSDGFFVDVDVSILYRIVDPYKVITTVGPGRLFENNGIVPKAEPVLKETLGELSTEEFYISPLRVEKTLKAKEMLNAELLPKGLQVEHVMVRYFQYSEEIQKNIEAKKLQDQLVYKNQAEKRAAEEGAKLQKVVSEGEALVKVRLQEGDAYRVKRIAERDLYVRKQHAEGDKLVQLAEAKKTDLKNRALEGAGSERLVGLKMADVYKGLEMIILSSDGAGGINPLDLKGTLEMFEVRKGVRK